MLHCRLSMRSYLIACITVSTMLYGCSSDSNLPTESAPVESSQQAEQAEQTEQSEQSEQSELTEVLEVLEVLEVTEVTEVTEPIEPIEPIELTDLTEPTSIGAAIPDESLTSNLLDIDIEISSVDPDKALFSMQSGDYGPFDDVARLADDRYLGTDRIAIISSENAGSIVDALIFSDWHDDQDEPQLATKPSPLKTLVRLGAVQQLAVSIGETLANRLTFHDCNNGEDISDLQATQGLVNGNVYFLVQVDFDNCKTENNFYLTGRIWLGMKVDDEDLIVDTVLAYDNLDFRTDNDTIRVSGAQRWETSRRGGAPIELISNLHMERVQTNHAVLLTDFEQNTPGNEGSSHYSYVKWTGLKGKIADSLIGSLDVDTPVLLRYAYNADGTIEQNINNVSSTQDGKLILQGGSGTSADFYGRTIPFTYRTHLSVVPTLTVRGADDVADDYNLTLSEAVGGGFLDLSDSDNDGIPRFWEVQYALDSNDASDAQMDNDIDGLTNLQEYHSLSDPNDSSDQGLFVELNVEIDTDYSGYRVGEVSRISSTIEISKLPEQIRLPLMTYSMILSEGLVWNQMLLPSRCHVEAQDNSVATCTFDDPLYSRTKTDENWDLIHTSAPFEFDIPAGFDKNVSITAQLNSALAGLKSDTVPAEFSLDLSPLAPADVKITGDVLSVGNAINLNTVKAQVNLNNLVFDSDISVQIAIPTGVLIQSAELFSTGAESLSSRCIVNSDVICSIDNIKQNDDIDLIVEYYLLDSEDHELLWTLTSSREDPETNDNNLITRLLYAKPVDELQALIDAASEGDTINLPAGVYEGGLSGRSRSDITVQGSTDGEATVLLATGEDRPAITLIGKRSIWSNLELRSAGAPIVTRSRENATIADSVIVPITGRPHKVKHVFESQGSSSIRFLRNRFEGWGAETGDQCENLFYINSYDNSYAVYVYLHNNEFIRNDCDSLINLEIPTDSFDHVGALFITNNTFVDNTSVV